MWDIILPMVSVHAEEVVEVKVEKHNTLTKLQMKVKNLPF